MALTKYKRTRHRLCYAYCALPDRDLSNILIRIFIVAWINSLWKSGTSYREFRAFIEVNACRIEEARKSTLYAAIRLSQDLHVEENIYDSRNEADKK